LIKLANLTEEDRLLLELRVKAECSVDNALETVCMFHKLKFIDRYSAAYKVCSDVLQIHKKPVRNSTLRIITLEWYQKVKLYMKV